MNKAAENTYRALRTEGTQKSVVDSMQTRKELYDSIGYWDFERKLDELFAKVHFASVGSNDLFQFAMASDRGNTRMSGRYDTLSLPFLRMLKRIIERIEKGIK